MNKQTNIPTKEYKIDIESTYPQTFIDGSKIIESPDGQKKFANYSCQNCAGNCANCQNNTNLNQSNGQIFSAQPNFQDLLPLLLKSLGGKGDMSSLMPLISKFSQSSQQNDASAIQNLLNLMPKAQNKNSNMSKKNMANSTPISSENSHQKITPSQIDNYIFIKDL